MDMLLKFRKWNCQWISNEKSQCRKSQKPKK